MTQSDVIQTILKDSNYHLALFSAGEIEAFISGRTTELEERSGHYPQMWVYNKKTRLLCH